MLHRFRQLSEREQFIILAGGISVLAVICYFLLWEPFAAKSKNLHAQLAAQQAAYQKMQLQAQQIQRLQAADVNNPTADTGGSLLGLLDQTLQQSALHNVGKRLEPKGEDRVHLDFPEVNFDALTGWLNVLQEQYRILPESASIERLAQAGQVRARLTLMR